MDFKHQPSHAHRQPLLSLRGSDPNNPHGYASYIYTDKTNLNPKLNFTGRNSSQHHRYSSQPSFSQEMYPIRGPRRSSSLKTFTPPSFGLPHTVGYSYLGDNDGQETAHQSYSHVPYFGFNNANRNYSGYSYNDRSMVNPWQVENNKKLKVKEIEESFDSGWFWVYKYLIVVLYCVSVLTIVVDVMGIFLSGSTFYYLLYGVLNAWEARQYYFEYIAIKEMKLKMAKKALELMSGYLLGGPLIYAVAEIAFNSNNSSGRGVVAFSIAYVGLFYLFILRKAMQVVDLLVERENLKQSVLLNV